MAKTLDGSVQEVYEGILKELEGSSKFDFEKLVKIEDEKVVVDWEGIKDLGSGEYRQRNVNRNLVDLGVLSFDIKGNFEVEGCGMNLGPMSYGNVLYFVDIDEARKYKEQVWSNATYTVNILRGC